MDVPSRKPFATDSGETRLKFDVLAIDANAAVDLLRHDRPTRCRLSRGRSRCGDGCALCACAKSWPIVKRSLSLAKREKAFITTSGLPRFACNIVCRCCRMIAT